MAKKYIVPRTKWLLGALSLFGFSVACGNEPVEYGCPRVSYKIYGTVTDAKGTPLRGIRVSETRHLYERGGIDTTKTDGSFALAFDETGFDVENRRIALEDVDGTAGGGLFGTDTINIKMSKENLAEKPSGHWYFGRYVKNVGKIILKKKNNK